MAKKVNTYLDYLSLCLRQIIALVRIRETQCYPVTIIKCLVGVLNVCYYIRGSALKTISRSDRHLAVALARSILCEKEAHGIQFSDSPYLCHQWLLHSRVYSASTEAVL